MAANPTKLADPIRNRFQLVSRSDRPRRYGTMIMRIITTMKHHPNGISSDCIRASP
jgi:hypothetical protein